MVRELLTHVREHFSHEEEFLEAVAYPEVRDHAGIHKGLLLRATELADQFERGQGSAGDLLGFLIHDVVARHILIEDRKFYPWFKKPSRTVRSQPLARRPRSA